MEIDTKLYLAILPRLCPITNEIRRRGVIADRPKQQEEVQIRVGDTLVIYETKSISKAV
jgi:hypothetical protein